MELHYFESVSKSHFKVLNQSSCVTQLRMYLLTSKSLFKILTLALIVVEILIAGPETSMVRL
jgi:hypothetical protein